jgi:anion-transporting  ArsA/GET3 family ATPase
MSSILDRELLVLSGRGGVGKTTLSAALGLLACDRGLRTIVVEVGEQSRLPVLFGSEGHEAGAETQLEDRLWSLSIDPDRALLEWLQSLGGRVSGRVLASSSTFQYFAAAAPGARELVSMVKIWKLTQKGRRGSGYDLVVLDAPATGHALGLLGSPGTFGAIARIGPIATQALRIQELLRDPERSGYLAVAHASELAVTETLELQERLAGQLGRELGAVLVNGVLPQRFSAGELSAISSLWAPGSAQGPGAGAAAVGHAAARAARAVSERARSQQNQLARLRRRGFAVQSVPFQFSAELDLAGVRRIAGHLGRRL